MLPPEIESRLEVFLRDLTLAWRHQATYPPGHPARAGGARAACTALADLLAHAGPFELGVLPDGLLVRGTRDGSPNAARIADRLSAWRVALVGFSPGLGDDEVAALLDRLADDPRKVATERFADALVGGGDGGVRVREIDYGALSLVESAGERGAGDRTLWRSIVEALLAGKILSGDEWSSWLHGGGDAEDLLAEVAGEGPAAAATGSAGTGSGAAAGPGSAGAVGERPVAVCQAVARAWLAAPAGERTEAAPRVARILSRLAGGVRGQLVAALAQRALALEPAGRDAEALLRALPAEDAVAAVKRLAAAPGGLGGSLLHFAQELGLASTAEVGPSAAELTEELRRRFGQGDLDAAGWTVGPAAAEPDLPVWDAEFRAADPSLPSLGEGPSGGTTLLHLALSTLELLAGQDDPEILAALGARLEVSVRELILGARLREAIDLVERLRRTGEEAGRSEAARRASRSCLDRLASRAGIATLVEALPEFADAELERARQLVERLGGAAVTGLLEALAEEEGRSRRNHLLAFLVSLGPRAVPPATAMLADPRWYVVRNMLVLLRQIGDRGPLGAVRGLARHADLRVQLEAIRTLFALETEPPTELLAAVLHDRDPKIAEAAVTLAGARGFVEAAAPLAELLRPWDLFGRRRALRLRALQALGQLGQPAVLAALDRYSRRFTLLPVAAEERRAFFHSLAGYPAEARAACVERGLAFPDPEIRETCRRLAAGEGAR